MARNEKMGKHVVFPSIEQYANIIEKVRIFNDFQGYDSNGDLILRNLKSYPILEFKGTPKLHGTNGGILFYKDGTRSYHSHKKEISIGADNCGFMSAMSSKDLEFFLEGGEFEEFVGFFGEWCGSGTSNGNCAIHSIKEKFFVVFAKCVDGIWYETSKGRDQNSQRIYNIDQVPSLRLLIDFNKPEESKTFLEEVTIAAEKECPFAIQIFGVSGIGEGYVWSCENPFKTFEGTSEYLNRLMFKTKGMLHKVNASKEVVSVSIEQFNQIRDFIEAFVTENRIQQAMEVNNVKDKKGTGIIVQWCLKDIEKESKLEVAKSGIDLTKISNELTSAIREKFFKILS